MRKGEGQYGKCSVSLVTSNKHKLEEVREILAPYGILVDQAPIPKLEVQSDSLETIAATAAAHAFLQLRRPVVVDDSGLFVDALKGFPGPYSSYVYKTIGYEGLLRILQGAVDRRACFRAAVAYAEEGLIKVFTGEVCGVISTEPRGTGGFGFDPVFIPDGHDSTFAEMGQEEKNKISHRGRAFRSFAEWYSKRCGAGGGI